MGNSLLDFVLSLVRDPQAAARYAADPAGALSAAGLPGVTITDVQNLIPVVADSLATTTPSFSDGVAAANVWTGSAAAAALDAFHVARPEPVGHAVLPQLDVGTIVEPPVGPVAPPAVDVPFVDPALDPAAAGPAGHLPLDPVGGGWADGDGHDVSHQGWNEEGGWHPVQPVQPAHPPADHPGFDLL
jgi:hypothetical protein